MLHALGTRHAMDDLFSDAGLARYDELRAKSEALLQNKSAPQPSSGHSGQARPPGCTWHKGMLQ